jgi:hypothetical protein
MVGLVVYAIRFLFGEECKCALVQDSWEEKQCDGKSGKVKIPM